MAPEHIEIGKVLVGDVEITLLFEDYVFLMLNEFA